MTRVLHLAPALTADIREAAHRAYPEECCGLIAGADVVGGWQALAVHAAANLAHERARRFLIDPQTQFDLMRRLRGTGRRVIGCFHSHPGGLPEPSAADRAEAYEPDFVYVIAGGAPDCGFALKAYVFSEDSGFQPLVLSPEAGSALP